MSSLTDRYVQAVVAGVAEPQRDDLERELRSQIADAMDAKDELGDATGQGAEYEVIRELGDPARLAADYAERPAWLLGPRYYFAWWRLLKLLIVILLPCAAAGIVIAQLIAGTAPGAIIGVTIGTLVTVTVHLVFWTTLVFVIIERSEAAADKRAAAQHALDPVSSAAGDAVRAADTFAWTPEMLPDRSPQRRQRVAEQVTAIVFLALGIAGLVWQQVASPVHNSLGEPVPVLNPDAWIGWLGALIVLMVVSALHCVVLAIRGWSLPLVITNLLLGVAGLAILLWAFLDGVLNPAFPPAIGWRVPAEGFRVAAIVIGVVMTGVVVWDGINSVLSWRRAERGGR